MSHYRVCGILCLALSLAACHHEPEETKVLSCIERGDVRSAGYGGSALAAATRGTISLSGRVVWDEDRTVRVSSPVPGYVTRILVRPGDTVTAGQALAALDSSGNIAGEVTTNGAAADGYLGYLLKVFDGSTPLVARNPVRKLVLRSPVAGVVVEQAISPGQILQPDRGGRPQFVITDPADLWLLLEARADDVGILRPGNRFKFHIGSSTNEAFQGVVVSIADFADPATQTFRVLVKALIPARRFTGQVVLTADISPEMSMTGLEGHMAGRRG